MVAAASARALRRLILDGFQLRVSVSDLKATAQKEVIRRWTHRTVHWNFKHHEVACIGLLKVAFQPEKMIRVFSYRVFYFLYKHQEKSHDAICLVFPAFRILFLYEDLPLIIVVYSQCAKKQELGDILAHSLGYNA